MGQSRFDPPNSNQKFSFPKNFPLQKFWPSLKIWPSKTFELPNCLTPNNVGFPKNVDLQLIDPKPFFTRNIVGPPTLFDHQLYFDPQKICSWKSLTHLNFFIELAEQDWPPKNIDLLKSCFALWSYLTIICIYLLSLEIKFAEMVNFDGGFKSCPFYVELSLSYSVAH